MAVGWTNQVAEWGVKSSGNSGVRSREALVIVQQFTRVDKLVTVVARGP